MPLKKACEWCGNEFNATAYAITRGQKTCSIECRSKLQRSFIYNDNEKTKKCVKCNEWKPFSSFAKNSKRSKTSKLGVSLQCYCRSCSSKLSREWAKENPEKRRLINKKSALLHAEEEKAKKREMSPEKRAKKNKATAAWRKANMEKVLMWNRLRRHRDRAAGKVPHRFEIGMLMCEQDARCTYCQALLSGDFHIDHKTPVSRGGTNELDNLQLLCKTCNLKKSAKTHEEYSILTGYTATELLERNERLLFEREFGLLP